MSRSFDGEQSSPRENTDRAGTCSTNIRERGDEDNRFTKTLTM